MFKHKLIFKSVPEIGTLIISEPIGFDKQGFIVKSDPKYFGRNIFIGKEDSDYVFSKYYFEQSQTIQILPNGDVIDHNSQGFFYLKNVIETFGWECEIEYVIEKKSTQFIVGILDGFTAEIEFDRITIKSIQNTNRELIKRLEDTNIDAFSHKALDGRTIQPCQTVNVLMLAKPIQQRSRWESKGINTFSDSNQPTEQITGVNFASFLTEFGVENSLTFFESIVNSSTISDFASFRVIKAQRKLTNLKVQHTIDMTYVVTQGALSGLGAVALYLVYGDEFNINFDNPNRIEMYVDQWNNTVEKTVTLNQTFEYTIPEVAIGQNVWLFWYVLGLADCDINGTVRNSVTEITATATAIDSVVKGVRLRDLANHTIQSISNSVATFKNYEVGQEHYENICFNGFLLGQITDKPFYNKFKDIKDIFLETCTGHQVNQNTIEFLPYTDFFGDELLAQYTELPSFDSKIKQSKDYALKTAEFKFKSSSTNRETSGENTIDDVHTETQKFISDKVDGNLSVEFDHIRSAYLGEEARMRAFDNKNTNALQNDNKLFIYKCSPLSPSYKSGFGAVLLMQVLENGQLQILNNNENGDALPFRWDLLGFSNGVLFQILEGENVGNYLVLSVTPSVVTLFPTTISPNFTGEAFIKVQYGLTNVNLVISTNQNFDLIEGIQNPTNYGNLDYSLGRVVNYWKPYLAAATKYKPNGQITTASFINNGNLVTRKKGETENTIDSDTIVNSSISELKKIDPIFKTVKVYSPFEKTLKLVEDIGTKKGYVKVDDFEGYPIELDYNWTTEELIMELQKRYVTDFINIEDFIFDSYEINIIYLSLFDDKGKRLIDPIDFKKVKINGVAYTDLIEFANALDND